LDPTFAQSIVDLSRNIYGIVELCHCAGNLLVHGGKDSEVAIAESVVQQHAVLLRPSRGATDNVNDGNLFRESSSDAVYGRELTDSESGDEGGNTLDSGVTVGSIGWCSY